MLTKIKYKRLAITLLILIGFFLIIGGSYALWVVRLSQETANVIATDCFNVSFKEENETIKLENTYPIYDEDGKKLTPYTFTITNHCEAYASYEVQLEILNTSTLKEEYLKIQVDEKSPVLINTLDQGKEQLTNSKVAYILDSNALDKNEEKTYNIRIWLDENVTTETEGVQGSTWSAKVTISAKYIDHIPSDYEKCVSKYGEGSVNCQIIAQVDETGKCPVVEEDGTVVVNSGEETDGYVCTAPDDYGTSYYFRGTVKNNWVKFANNYWRIIRINGDNSIRMIYAGDATVIDSLANKEEVLKNGYNDGSTDYTQIGVSRFNALKDDNAYVGYMYGTPGSATYEDTHANINSSEIKVKVDEWYEAHLKGTEYESYLSDVLFCNDRSLGDMGTGIGTSETRYRSYKGSKNLKCKEQNDRFTGNDKNVGNGALTYPIGIVSADEIYLAGGYSNNQKYYLFTGNYYWTSSPFYFTGGRAGNRFVTSGGDLSYGYVDSSRGVRPVINLKANSLKHGNGTAIDPYTI